MAVFPMSSMFFILQASLCLPSNGSFFATEIIKWIWSQNWGRLSSSLRPHHRLRWEGVYLL